MSDHYYSSDPHSDSHPVRRTVSVLGREFQFVTDAGVFSRNGLDQGSQLLIESAGEIRSRALDLGCGWGAMGVVLALLNPAARFVLSDINRRAVELTQANIEQNGARNAEAVLSDGFESLSGTFDQVFCNPPIRAGKPVVYRLFDESHARLSTGGALTIVIRKQQGAPSALKHLRELFGNAEVIARGVGYWVIRAEKTQEA